MVDRYDKAENITIFYRARGRTTGLTDVKITIYDKDGNTDLVNDQTMTEIGSSGIYQYFFAAPNYGKSYIATMDSATKLFKQEYEFMIAPIRKVFPGAVGVVGVWTHKEKEDFLKEFKKLINDFKKHLVGDKTEEQLEKMNEIDKILLLIELKLIKLKDKIDNEFEDNKLININKTAKLDELLVRLKSMEDQVQMHGKALSKLLTAQQLEEIYNET